MSTMIHKTNEPKTTYRPTVEHKEVKKEEPRKTEATLATNQEVFEAREMSKNGNLCGAVTEPRETTRRLLLDVKKKIDEAIALV